MKSIATFALTLFQYQLASTVPYQPQYGISAVLGRVIKFQKSTGSAGEKKPNEKLCFLQAILTFEVKKYFFEHFSHFPGNVVQVAPVYQRSAIVPHNSCAFKDPILMGNLHSSTMPFYVL